MDFRVLVTRPLAQNQGLVKALISAEMTPVIYPLLSIQGFPPTASDHYPLIRTQVQRLAEFDVLIFISTNAANIACEWFDAYWPQLPIQSWFAIGKATSGALEAHNLLGQPAIIADSMAMNSESLLALPALQSPLISGKRVMIVRGVGGRETLKQTLQERGASIEYLEVYQRQFVDHPKHAFATCLAGGLQVLTITSGESLDKLLEEAMMNKKLAEVLALPLVVPSLRLYEKAESMGFLRPFCAKNAGVKAMLDTITLIKNEGTLRGD